MRLNDSGNHANCPSACIESRMGHAFHQSHVASAIDNGMSLFGSPLSEFVSKREEIAVNVVVGTTEYSDVHIGFMVYSL